MGQGNHGEPWELKELETEMKGRLRSRYLPVPDDGAEIPGVRQDSRPLLEHAEQGEGDKMPPWFFPAAGVSEAMSLRLTRQYLCAVLSAVGGGMTVMVKVWLLALRPLLTCGRNGTPAQEIPGLQPSLSLLMSARVRTHARKETPGMNFFRASRTPEGF